MNTYFINKTIGDIIYALPAIQASGGGTIVTGMPEKDYLALKPLIDNQKDIVLEHIKYGLQPGVINLEDFRTHPEVTTKHICEVFGDILGVQPNYKFGWLDISDRLNSEQYSIINVTNRYRDKFFNWGKEINFLKKNSSYIKFIGTYKEYIDFVFKYSKVLELDYYPTNNFYEVAKLINSCKFFSGNQSACLAIAEGLGRSYRYERSPFWDNVRLNTKRETILNSNRTRRLHYFFSGFEKLTLKNFQK